MAVYLWRMPKPFDSKMLPGQGSASTDGASATSVVPGIEARSGVPTRPQGVAPKTPKRDGLVHAPAEPAPPAPKTLDATASASAAASARPAAPAAATTAPAPTKLEYHDILTGKSDAKPSPPPAAGTAAPATKAAAAAPTAHDDRGGATAHTQWFVQAGAFHNAADADNVKAQLALAGVEARIQTLSVPGASKLHRVRVGPYDRVEDAERVRAQLAQNRIDAAVVIEKPTR
jgi:cell division protein FtsN